MNMWSLYEKKSLLKEIHRKPKAVLKQYEFWKRVIEHEGPDGLRLIRGYRDEALKGEWAGFRSSRLNRQWRVIYKVEKQLCEVYVIDINPHNYRGKHAYQ